MELAVGDIVDGKVTGITKFGAFVEIPGKKVGLVHISEVSHDYVKDVTDFLKTNDEIKVKILKLDGEKISLSLKAALSAPPLPKVTASKREAASEFVPRHKGNEIPHSFEDMMKRFMQDSNERQGEVKRNRESRKGYK
ncbi:MAG: S1 RNA-binding domain-containing protein [Bacillota bacterium]|nr:S1 RNA-binding domain-containing protein [Bacillota bacterium]